MTEKAASPVLCGAPVPRRCDRPAEFVADGTPTCALHLATTTRYWLRHDDTEFVIVTRRENTDSHVSGGG